MVQSDSLLSKLMPGLLVAAAVFAAWWMFIKPHHHAPVPQQGPGVLDTPSSARPYLLQASQVGPEYDQLADATRSTTSTGIRAGEPPAGLALINSSWKGGARAGWYQVHGAMTVDSRAELFSTSALFKIGSGAFSPGLPNGLTLSGTTLNGSGTWTLAPPAW